jgi:hypothetical protein
VKLIMAQNEDISLRSSLAPDVVEVDTHNGREGEILDGDVVDSRHDESSRKRACVLLGSAMLQLPIWGGQY